MDHIKTVGNIKVYATKNADNNHTISLRNSPLFMFRIQETKEVLSLKS